MNPHPSLFSHIIPKFILKSPKPGSFIFFSPKIESKFPTRSSYNFSFDDPTDPRSGPDDPSVVDEWGEKSGPEPEPTCNFIGTDLSIDDDEWGGSAVTSGNGSPAVNEEADGNVVEDERFRELKRALVDAVYVSDFGPLPKFERRPSNLCHSWRPPIQIHRQSSARSYLVETGF